MLILETPESTGRLDVVVANFARLASETVADREVSMIPAEPIFILLTLPFDEDPPAKFARFDSDTVDEREVSITPNEPIFILLTPPLSGLPAALAPPATESYELPVVFIVDDEPDDISVPPVEPPENIDGIFPGLAFAGSNALLVDAALDVEDFFPNMASISRFSLPANILASDSYASLRSCVYDPLLSLPPYAEKEYAESSFFFCQDLSPIVRPSE